jgi:hypothetical protein
MLAVAGVCKLGKCADLSMTVGRNSQFGHGHPKLEGDVDHAQR